MSTTRAGIPDTNGDWRRWVTDTLTEVKTAVDKLPTREQLEQSSALKVDRASYEIAHRTIEDALRQQTLNVTTLQQALASTNDRVTTEQMKGQTSHQEMQEAIRASRTDIDELLQKPNQFRNSATFYALIAGVAVSLIGMLCSNGLAVTTLVLHLTGH